MLFKIYQTWLFFIVALWVVSMPWYLIAEDMRRPKEIPLALFRITGLLVAANIVFWMIAAALWHIWWRK